MPVVKKSKAHIELGTDTVAVVKLFKNRYTNIASTLGVNFVDDDAQVPTGKVPIVGIANSRRVGLSEINIVYQRSDGVTNTGRVYAQPDKVNDALKRGPGIIGKKYGNNEIIDAYLDMK
jgi:hypothetical protein